MPQTEQVLCEKCFCPKSKNIWAGAFGVRNPARADPDVEADDDFAFNLEDGDAFEAGRPGWRCD
jgi:hypothetical protein